MSRSIRFVHCGGFCFDSHLWQKSESPDVRNEELWQIFDSALRLCRAEKADFLFITGDLFEQEDISKETVERVAGSFSKLKGTRVFITPGDKDPLVTTSAYRLSEWSENVHIFSEGLSSVEIPSLGVTVFGSGWITYHQDENPLDGFPVNRDSKKIKFMLLHAEVESAMNTEGFIPIREEQIEASGLTYLALGHKERYSGIQKTGQTYWADCGTPRTNNHEDSESYGVILGETDGEITHIEFKVLEQHTSDQHTKSYGNTREKDDISSRQENHLRSDSKSGFPVLTQIFMNEIQRCLTSEKSAEKQKHWKLVLRIGLSALNRQKSDQPLESQEISESGIEYENGIFYWPDLTEDDFYHRTCNIRETGEESLSLAKAKNSLERAKKRVEEQVDSMEKIKEEYDMLRHEWDAVNRRQEEQRLLQIEIKKLQARKNHLNEKIAGIRKLQERLNILWQNPDYTDLRRIQGELYRLEELYREKAEELTAYTNHIQVDWDMIENLREECLAWAGLEEEAEHLNRDIKKLKQHLREIESSLLLSGYHELPQNEDEYLLNVQKERESALDELKKMGNLLNIIKSKEEILSHKEIKLQKLAVFAEVSTADERRIKKTVERLMSWQRFRFSGPLDHFLKESLGFKDIQAGLTSRLNHYCQKYQAADYDDFERQLLRYRELQQEVKILRAELDALNIEIKREQELQQLIRTRSQILAEAFSTVKAADLDEWLKGWEDYRGMRSLMIETEENIRSKEERQKEKTRELNEYAVQLREKLRDWVPPTSDIDEVLGVVMKVASKLRAKEEAEKDFHILKQRYDSQLGKRNMEQLAGILEPLADLEREECIGAERREAEVNACLREVKDIDRQLAETKTRLQNSQAMPSKADLERKLQALKQHWKSSEELQQALDDTSELLETSQSHWREKYGKALETLARNIFAVTFPDEVSEKKEDIRAQARKYYFAYRMALTLSDLEHKPDLPVSFSIEEMKGPAIFWEGIVNYLYELSLARQVILKTEDKKIKKIAEEMGLRVS